MSDLLESFGAMVESGDLHVIDRVTVPSRGEVRESLPAVYRDGPLAEWLRSGVAADGSLWRHQSRGLVEIAAGRNLVIATGTASGKSLAFQIPVLHELLSGEGRALVLYPLKALLSDQALSWRRQAAALGLPNNTVAELHGQVLMDDRMDAARHSRVLLATPDAIHAWMMRQVALPTIRELLCALRFIIIDEAHIYESVFGSNVAYLMRRLLAARRRACREKSVDRPLQLIAATATIADPAVHMANLTGWPFEVVGEADDGSPTHSREILHVEGPDYGSAAETMLSDVVSRLIGASSQGSLIGFHDSRQGVERVARQVNDDSVLPYRAGYQAADRAKIERALREGRLRGVISTPALELGIDIPGFVLGLTIGVPQSKKAFRQRLGRVGRASRGAFAVVAPRHAFTRFGSSFGEYYAGSVEPSHLYLGNRFIQFAQARCLLDESELLGAETREPPPGVSWPDSFGPVFDLAKPGARRPREYDFIAALGANAPHYNYPLRQVGEVNYPLKSGVGMGEDEVGDIALNQAIREAYPGATYLHLRRPMRVLEWRTTTLDRSIRLEEVKSGPPTRPMLRKSVNVAFGSDDIVEGRIRSGANGLLAEVYLQVNESVEGYRIGSTAFMYRDLRQKNPRMSRKQRDFRTTGVVLKIEEPWFTGGAPVQSKARADLAEALAAMLKRERSISPNDVDSAATHIAIYDGGSPRRVTDTIVIYDSIYGGLRLTESLFDEIGDYIARLSRAAQEAGDQAFVSAELAERVRDWAAGLQQGAPSPDRSLTAPEGQYVIYMPGSVVSVMNQGVHMDRTLIAPLLIDFGAGTALVYTYDNNGRGVAMVPHEQVQPTGQDWTLGYWDPTTGEIIPVSMEVDTF